MLDRIHDVVVAKAEADTGHKCSEHLSISTTNLLQTLR